MRSFRGIPSKTLTLFGDPQPRVDLENGEISDPQPRKPSKFEAEFEAEVEGRGLNHLSAVIAMAPKASRGDSCPQANLKF